MRNCGKLVKSNNYYHGEVTIAKTEKGAVIPLKIALNAKPLAAGGIENSDKPSHTILLAGTDLEIGAAWTKTSKKDGTLFLSFSIDLPEFEAPINLSAFEDKNANDNYNVLWSRAKKVENLD